MDETFDTDFHFFQKETVESAKRRINEAANSLHGAVNDASRAVS